MKNILFGYGLYTKLYHRKKNANSVVNHETLVYKNT